jgi:ABC-2 type transport system ATP-binding protein
MIEARELSRFYGGFVAVQDVSFAIPAGQVVALLGPNGAGKTTLMRMLTGYLAPSAGAGTIDGLDVVGDRLEVAARVGYLPENGPLYPDMTAREILRFVAAVRRLGPRQFRDRLEAVIVQCELAGIVDKPLGKLSKGLRQRVGLSLALLHDPPVLILDEPTSGLDPNQIRRFRAHVRELRQVKTLIVSTHILQEVEAIADRVLLMHNGRLVFDGSPAALAERGSLEEPFYRLTHGTTPSPPSVPRALPS